MIVYVEECGCCGCYHRPGYIGDCRNDAERFYPPCESVKCANLAEHVHKKEKNMPPRVDIHAKRA